MSYSRNYIEALKARVPKLEFYRAEIPTMPSTVRSNGLVDGGLCPFHNDRHKGNFKIDLRTGGFHCFSCGAHGNDVISFVRQRYGFDFGEAVDWLAKNWEHV